MTSAQVVETNNSSSQIYTHPDDHTIRTTDTPGQFKPFTMLRSLGRQSERLANNYISLVSTVKRIRQQLWLNHRCKDHGLVPAGLKLKSPLNTQEAIQIVQSTCRRLVKARINDCHRRLNYCNKKLQQQLDKLRAQLYGLGYPRQPFPRGNFVKRLYEYGPCPFTFDFGRHFVVAPLNQNTRAPVKIKLSRLGWASPSVYKTKTCPARQGYPTCRGETTRPPELSRPPRQLGDIHINGCLTFSTTQ